MSNNTNINSNSNKRNSVDLSKYVITSDRQKMCNDLVRERAAMRSYNVISIGTASIEGIYKKLLEHYRDTPNMLAPIVLMKTLKSIRFHVLVELNDHYVEPLCDLIFRNKCNMHVAKQVLWFLYPGYHMGSDVSTIWKIMDERIFTRDQAEEDTRVKL